MAHRDARLTPHGRLLLVTRVLDQQRRVAHVVAELGVSWASDYKQLDRYRRAGLAGLLDRASRAHRCPFRTNSDLESCHCRAAPAAQARAGSDPRWSG